MARKKTVTEVAAETGDAKRQSEYWKAQYDDLREKLLGMMQEERIKTVTVQQCPTEHENTLCTVVVTADQTGIDEEELTKVLKAKSLYGKVYRKKIVTVYERDDDKLAELIANGTLTKADVAKFEKVTRTGSEYVKVTIQQAKS